MLTEKRLAELERAAVNALASYHEDCSLSVRASELAELCLAVRHGDRMWQTLNDHEIRIRRLEYVSEHGAWVPPSRVSEPDSVPTADFMALGDCEEETAYPEHLKWRWSMGGTDTPEQGMTRIYDADIDRSIIRRQARDLLDRARAISHSWEQFARPSNSSNSGSEWLQYRESAKLLKEVIALLGRIAGETGK